MTTTGGAPLADIPHSSGEASGWRHAVEEFKDAEKDALMGALCRDWGVIRRQL